MLELAELPLAIDEATAVKKEKSVMKYSVGERVLDLEFDYKIIPNLQRKHVLFDKRKV